MKIETKEEYDQLINLLYNLSCGDNFINFQSKIINTQKQIIGVKVPVLRKLAKKINNKEHSGFFKYTKNNSFEEIFLKGLLIVSSGDRESVIKSLNNYYELIDNWAIVDMVAGSIKYLKCKKTQEDFEYFTSLLKSDKEFTVRFGVVCLMKYFINDDFKQIIDELTKIVYGRYYVDMAVAWLISEIIIKNPQNALEIMQDIIKNKQFNKFIINKSLQKARESYRIDNNLKIKLNELKIK